MLDIYNKPTNLIQIECTTRRAIPLLQVVKGLQYGWLC